MKRSIEPSPGSIFAAQAAACAGGLRRSGGTQQTFANRLFLWVVQRIEWLAQQILRRVAKNFIERRARILQDVILIENEEQFARRLQQHGEVFHRNISGVARGSL